MIPHQVIKPTGAAFKGSALEDRQSYSVLKPGVRSISFKDYPQGFWFVICPPYTVDENGNPVWYKVVTERVDFGLGDKRNFPVNDTLICPVAFFESRFKEKYPHLATVTTITENGKTRKKYPPYGRTRKKVLLNIFLCQNPAAGNFILEIPAFGPGSEIAEYTKKTTMDGRPKPFLNDPSGGIAIMIKKDPSLGLKAWELQIEENTKVPMPPDLTIAANLYNLDAVVRTTDIYAVIDELAVMFDQQTFDYCMAGYPMLPEKYKNRANTNFAGGAPVGYTPLPQMAAPDMPTRNPIQQLAPPPVYTPPQAPQYQPPVHQPQPPQPQQPPQAPQAPQFQQLPGAMYQQVQHQAPQQPQVQQAPPQQPPQPPQPPQYPAAPVVIPGAQYQQQQYAPQPLPPPPQPIQQQQYQYPQQPPQAPQQHQQQQYPPQAPAYTPPAGVIMPGNNNMSLGDDVDMGPPPPKVPNLPTPQPAQVQMPQHFVPDQEAIRNAMNAYIK